MRLTHDDYTVAWICAVPIEIIAAKAMLAEIHSPLPQPKTDHNVYMLGTVRGHNVVLVCLPLGVYGTVSASTTVSHMVSTYPNIQFGLMVGIGGGVPSRADIRLGDVVVSRPIGSSSGVVRYDYGKTVRDGKLQRTGSLNKPPQVLLKAIAHLEGEQMAGKMQISDTLSQTDSTIREQFARPERDMLFKADYYHEQPDNCSACDQDQLVDRPLRDKSDEPYIHYGLIASGDQVMKDAKTRDSIADELDIICFEMEAAGIMDELPSLVIRGICDYCDSHKHKEWQPYAALTAAAYAKTLLSTVPVIMNNNKQPGKVGFTPNEEECLRSLFLTDPEDDKNALRRRKGGRAAGTCEWILETDELMDWLQMSDSQGGSNILWLHGNPGTGKSTMAITMAEEIPKLQAFTEGTKILAYFFCDSSNDKQRTAVSILRGLIHYLVKQCPHLAKFLLPKYNERKEGLNNSFDALWGILMEMGKDSAVEIYCIIDALDECESDSQPDLIRQIHHSFGEQLADSPPPHLHILITSRPYPEISEYLSHFRNKDLASYSAIEHDIRRMIEAKVEDLAVRKKYPDSVKIEVSRILEDKAEGTFLWIGIACSELARPEVRARNATKILKEMPRGLHDLYRQLLNTALVDRGNDDDEKEIMKNLMKFVAFARRPLMVLELADACQLYPDDDVDSRLQFTQELIELCRLIIVIQDHRVWLLHKSVKDFLVKEELGMEEVEAHAEMANHCINHILDFIETASKDETSFLKYAGTYWPEHAGHADTAWAVGPQQESFFEPDSGAWEKWQGWHNRKHGGLYDQMEEGFDIFHAAARWEIIPLFLWGFEIKLHQHGKTYHDTEFQTVSGVTPLEEAARNGNTRILLTLLDNIKAGLRVSTRVINAAAGNEESGYDVMKLLLSRRENHAEINEEVLKSAAKNGQSGKKIMELLLDQRESQIHVSEEVVKAAARNRRSGRDVIELLLDRQGDQVQLTDKVLRTAARNSYSGPDILALLLDRREGQIQITEEVLRTAARYAYRVHGQDILALLLDRRGGQIQITEEVVKNAVYNERSGGRVIKLLLDRQGDRIPVTEAIVKAAVRCADWRGKLPQLLSGKYLPSLITEEVLKAAAANQTQGLTVMQFFLDEYLDSDYCVTPDVLIAALSNQKDTSLALLLLDRTPEQFDLTEDIWEAAIYNKNSADHVNLLLQKNGNMDLVLTECLLMAISSHTWKRREELIILFLNAGSSCTVTKRVLEIVVRWFDADIMVLLLQNGQLRVTKDQITAAFPGDNRLQQSITSLMDTQLTIQASRIQADLPAQEVAYQLNSVIQARVLDDHNGEVWRSQFSHDGSSLCTAGSTGRLIIYETKTFSIVGNLPAHEKGIVCLAYSPNDTRLTTSAQDGLVKIWDAKTYDCIHILKDVQPTNSLLWVTDEEIIVSTLDCLTHWSITGSCIYRWRNPFNERIACCCITPDHGHLLVSSSRELHVLDIKTRARKFSFATEARALFLAVDPISNSGHLLASLVFGEVQLLDFNQGTVIRRLRGHHQSIFLISSTFLGVDQSLVLSGSEDSRIYVWDRSSGALVDILEGHESGCVYSLTTNPRNPDMLASSGDDGTVRIWVRKGDPE